jgi:NADH:ubiquinone oxidoreductase subunit F (NADH-binding)
MNLIEELYARQEAHGYLREEDLRALSGRIRVPLYEVQGVASFYPHFRLTPPRRAHVSACRDISCKMRGGDAVCRRLRELCSDREDIEFQEASCLGRCDGAPACAVNDVPVDPGLRGMGGAGFPTGAKWELVRKETAEPKYVVCNADESEPGTFKDRVILEELPHLVVEGIILGALAVGAHEAWIYIRHEYGKECKAIRRAVREAYASGVLGERVFGSDFSLELQVFVAPGGYILGEETAMLEALEGKRGEPRNKPPYPGTHGLYGKPTLVNNVESLALVPHIARTGKADLKFFSVSGDVNEPGVHEAPVGTTLRQLVDRCGGMRDDKEILAFLPGGPSTWFLRGDQADIVMDWEPLWKAESSLGSGAVVVVGEGADMLSLARNLTAFFRNESCGKCVPCRIGLEKAVMLIDNRRKEDLDVLRDLHEALVMTSICGLGQVGLNPLQGVLHHFSGVFEDG